jgi:putative flavoprotein involved in K+ transport
VEHFDVLVIGGGQAGLAAGYHLSRLGARYVIVDERRRVGDAWRTRWDSLRLFTPARIDGLPGMPYPAAPGATVTKDAMAEYLEAYATRFGLPVRLGVRVQSLSRTNGRFVTDVGLTADNVVVATSSHGTPFIPEFASGLNPAITRLHSTEYRNPSQLQAAVLVVGAGNSGAEIALDAAGAGHRTWLSGRPTGKIPYPMVYWPPLWWVFTRPAFRGIAVGERGQPLVRVRPQELVAAGIMRVPRVASVEGGKPRLEDGRVLDAGTVVWCTGFRETYGWIDLQITDETGHLNHERGVSTSQPGLYFVGLRGQHSLRSSLVDGVGEDARYVVDRIAGARTRA